MEEAMYQKSYMEYKEELAGELQKTAEGFVRIGYLLKVARDTNILAESGYQTVTEFAEAEYNLDKTQVSRFISINDRFSKEGYSDRLKDSYKDFGYAKLTIMLQLPEELTEELSPGYSKTEIQAIKDEVEEEKKVSDIELAIEKAEIEAEEKKILPPVEGSMLGRAVWQLGREQHDIYRKIWKAFEAADKNRIKDIMAPQGDAVYMVRIPGTGRLMLSISGEAVSVTEVRSQTKERYTIQDMTAELEQICPVAGMDVAEAYRSVYDEELETETKSGEKPGVAPVQQKKEKRKESRVTKARTEKPEPAAAVETEEEEQLPGQMGVEDYEGVVPESHYEEVKEDGRTDTGHIAGMSEGGGAAGDALEPGTDAGASGEAEDADTGNKPDAGNGAAEGGGCETDNGTAEEDVWMEVREANRSLNQYFAVWSDKESMMELDVLKSLHTKALSLAAGIEKIMILRAGDNE